MATKETQAMLRLAEAGLAKRTRPCRLEQSSVADELFKLDADIVRSRRALECLEASFKTTDVHTLTDGDATTFRREVTRRRKHIAQLEARKGELMAAYAVELLESCAIHPELADAIDALNLAR